jgi:S1-C subfamily serine protease
MKRKSLLVGILLGVMTMALFGYAAVAGAQGQGGRGNGEERPLLGVRLEQTADGIMVVAVLPESPAAAADIQINDIVTAVNGETVETARQAVRALRGLNPGDIVTLDVTRGEETLTLEATLGSLSDLGEQMGGRPQGMPPFGMEMMLMPHGRLGILSEQLTSEIAAELDVAVTEGAVVREVLADTPAAEVGLQANDIITAVNGEPVDAERTLLNRLIAYEPGDTITLTVLRGGETLELEVTLVESRMEDWMGGMWGGRGGRGDHNGMGQPPVDAPEGAANA